MKQVVMTDDAETTPAYFTSPSYIVLPELTQKGA